MSVDEKRYGSYSKNIFCRPTGFRGKTIEILSLLSNSGGLTVREIAEKVDISPPDCWNYLKRGDLRGIFARKENWGWVATPYGLFILDIKPHNNNNNIDTRPTLDRHYIDTRPTLTLDSPKKKQRQLNWSVFDERSDWTDLGEDEKKIILAMGEHYERTGRPYYYFKDLYALREQFKIDIRVDDIFLQDMLLRLDHNGWIRARTSKGRLKIVLEKSRINELEHL